MIARMRFGCPSCGAFWTPPLRRLPAWLEKEERWDVCSESPIGTWSIRPENRGRPDHPVALNIQDVQGLVQHEDLNRSIGCCGTSYRERLPNLRCATCKYEAAFRLSDGDHCNHAIFVPTKPLLVEPFDELDDDTLQEIFSARRLSTNVRLPDAGMDAIPGNLRVSIDKLWDEDIQNPNLFPTLKDFAVDICGLEMRLSLDGLVVRPPWPDGERDRLIALGAIPKGLPDEPLSWWTDSNPRSPEPMRHHWWQWYVDDQICVAWQRAPNGRYTEREAIAFRVPWDLWELAFHEALE